MLTISEDIYEHFVVLSVKMEDQDAFQKDFPMKLTFISWIFWQGQPG